MPLFSFSAVFQVYVSFILGRGSYKKFTSSTYVKFIKGETQLKHINILPLSSKLVCAFIFLFGCPPSMGSIKIFTYSTSTYTNLQTVKLKVHYKYINIQRKLEPKLHYKHTHYKNTTVSYPMKNGVGGRREYYKMRDSNYTINTLIIKLKIVPGQREYY